MKKSQFLFAYFLLSLFASQAWSGPRVTGNGGDVIRCFADESIYSLDYIMTKFSSTNQFTEAPIKNLNQSLARISELLNKKLPKLAKSFDTFVSDLQNHNSNSVKYKWVASDFLEEINDEHFYDDPLPTQCRKSLSGIIEVSQAVVRKQLSPELVLFEYDQEVLNYLAPLQLSFVFVHEWLWDISSSVEKNRKINFFLHSAQFSQMSPENATEYLKKLSVPL